MAVNKLISIKVPVLNALQDIGADHAKHTPNFIRWAADAERQIGSYYSLSRIIKTLVVDKYRAALPVDAMFVQRVLLGDHSEGVFDLFNTWLLGFTNPVTFSQTETFLVIDNPGETTSFTLGNFPWEIQNNYIVLSGDYDKQKITVQYLGLITDDDGFPKVSENHVEAIVHYIMYKFSMMSQFSSVKMETGFTMYLAREWGRLKNVAKSLDDQFTESQRNQILSILHDPMSGPGLSGNFGLYARDEY